MTHRYRYRMAALAVAGAVLLVPGMAGASPDTPTVTFDGGCGLLGLGASAQPDEGAVDVRPGTTVTFVNHLGQSAQLVVNGTERGSIPADHEVGILFKQGTATVALVPGCLLSSQHAGTVTVAVRSANSTGSASAMAPVAPQADPAHTMPHPTTSRTSASPGATPPDGTPAPSSPTDPSLGTGLDPLAPGVIASATPSAAPSDDMLAVGAVGPAAPGRGGATGLLSLVATLCVAGVTIAAIRSIISQRASRAVVA